jgi:hypothetical protein
MFARKWLGLATSLFAAVLLTGCSSPAPTGPTVQTNADVSGVWAPAGATSGGWRLVQRGTSVEGTSLPDPSAEYPSTTTLTGTVSGSQFSFSGMIVQTRPDDEYRTAIGGTLTVAAGTMSGLVSSQPQPPHSTRGATGPMTYVRVVAGS